MSPRVRMTYSKRGRACFVPHIALPSVFSRSAARAGIVFQVTEGFSPRAKISLGPELPVGVAALCEPLEVWLGAFGAEDLARWNMALPEGFALTGAEEVHGMPGTPGARALSKWCEGSSCIFAPRQGCGDGEAFQECLRDLQGSGDVLYSAPFMEDGRHFIRCILPDPSRRGPGLLVRAFREKGLVRGWQDLFFVREVVGRMVLPQNPGGIPEVLPLIPAFDGGVPAEEKIPG